MENSDPSCNRVLASLSPADAALLSPWLKLVSLEQGALLADIGDEIEHVYFPHSGMISLLSVTKSGRGVETAIIGREGVIGAMAGLGLHFTLSQAVAQVPLVAMRIAAAPFRNVVKGSDTLRDLIVRWSEVLIAQVQITAACNALHPIGQRLARWILQTKDRTADDAIPLTQQRLSDVLGVQRSSISEVAGMLQALGLIHYSRGIIEILDRPGLEKAACECYASINENAARILPAARTGIGTPYSGGPASTRAG